MLVFFLFFFLVDFMLNNGCQYFHIACYWNQCFINITLFCTISGLRTHSVDSLLVDMILNYVVLH